MLSRCRCVLLFVTLRTIACQAPLSMGFCGREYWSGLPCPAPGDLSDPGIEPMFLTSPALASGFFTTSTTWQGPSSLWKWKSLSCVQLFVTPWLYSPRNSSGQNTEMGSLSFSRGSSQPQNQTRVFCIAGGFFTNWAIREAHGASQMRCSFNIFFWFALATDVVNNNLK